MRDPKRIPLVLKGIEEVWENYPDMRLGQLLLNVCRDPMIYYLEDEELVKRLKQFYLENPNEGGNK